MQQKLFKNYDVLIIKMIILIMIVKNEQDGLQFMKSFFFQAEDGIRDSVASRGLGDVYKGQRLCGAAQTRQERA